MPAYLWSSYIFCTSVQTPGIWWWIRWHSRNYSQWRKSYSEREEEEEAQISENLGWQFIFNVAIDLKSFQMHSFTFYRWKIWVNQCFCKCLKVCGRSSVFIWCPEKVSYLWQRTLFGQSALVHFFEQLFQCVPDGCMIPLLTRQILQLWIPITSFSSQKHYSTHILLHVQIQTFYWLIPVRFSPVLLVVMVFCFVFFLSCYLFYIILYIITIACLSCLFRVLC